VILVGLGDIGINAHLPALLRNPDLDLVALVEPDPARLAAAGKLVPSVVECARDLSTVSVEYDAAVVATPPWVTPRIVRDLLSRDRVVLAEKPFATSVEQIEELEAADPRVRTHVQVGVTYRHHPHLRRLRSMIDEGLLGPRRGIRVVVHDEAASDDPEHGSRMMEALRHGNPLLHEGTHIFDWLAYVTRETYTMTSMSAWRTRDDLPEDNFCRADLIGSAGTRVAIDVSWLEEKQPPSIITVMGDKGYCELDVATFALRLHTRSGVIAYDPETDRTATAFDEQLTAFLRLVHGTHPPDPGVQVAVDALRLMDQAAALAKATDV